MKNHKKIFMTLHTKLKMVQRFYILILVKYINILENIFGRIRYLVMSKSNLSNIFYNKYLKIKINSDDDVPLEKTSNIYYGLKLIRSYLIIKITTTITTKHV